MDNVRIRNWNNYSGCMFGEKAWGHFEDGVFIDESYKKGDFPIVWCVHDDKPCDAISEEWCCINQDHSRE